MSSSVSLLRRVGRFTGKAAGVTVLGGGIVGTYIYVTDSGVQRSTRFWSQVGPILAHYAWHRYVAKDDADKERRYKELHAQHAPDMRRVIEDLRGMFIKVGQVLSVRPEILPVEYRNELRKLQDEAPALRWEAVESSLVADLGAPTDEVFAWIDRNALGAASIGQAHLVEWQGRKAVIKVRYPDAVTMFWADFRCLENFLWIIGTEVSADALLIIQKLRDQFSQELDYEREASNLRQLHTAIDASEFRSKILVPSPIQELTKGNTIGMEYLPGVKLEGVLRTRLEALGVDMKGRSLQDVLRSQQSQALDTGAQNEQQPAEDKSGEDGMVIDAGKKLSRWNNPFFRWVVRLVGVDFAFWLVGLFTDLRIARGSSHNVGEDGNPAETMSAAQLRELLHMVVSVHGYQVFFCPMFNGDPHPGNVLLLPDGRIGLIDFGQCRKLEFTERMAIAKLIMALTDPPDSPGQDKRVADAVLATGIETKNSDVPYLALLPRLMFCSLRPEWLDRENLRPIFENDRVTSLPIHMMMLYRTSMLLRGTCLVLQENVNPAALWRPWAEQWLRENTS